MAVKTAVDEQAEPTLELAYNLNTFAKSADGRTTTGPATYRSYLICDPPQRKRATRTMTYS